MLERKLIENRESLFLFTAMPPVLRDTMAQTTVGAHSSSLQK